MSFRFEVPRPPSLSPMPWLAWLRETSLRSSAGAVPRVLAQVTPWQLDYPPLLVDGAVMSMDGSIAKTGAVVASPSQTEGFRPFESRVDGLAKEGKVILYCAGGPGSRLHTRPTKADLGQGLRAPRWRSVARRRSLQTSHDIKSTPLLLPLEIRIAQWRLVAKAWTHALMIPSTSRAGGSAAPRRRKPSST